MFEWLRSRSRREREIQDEIDYHLDMLASEEQQQGASSQEARLASRRKLGSVALTREKTREVWIWPAIERFFQDVRYAARGLKKHPVFALAAVLSLALGIGANTAIFSLIDALLLRMLPVHNPGELVAFVTTQNGRQLDSFPYEGVRALAQEATAFSSVCGFSGAEKMYAGLPGAEKVASGQWVTGGYYQTLGVPAVIGRLLTPDDDRPSGGVAAPVAVLSYRFWQNEFHGDSSVIGKALLIDGSAATVVGVSAPGFEGANVGSTADLTLPLSAVPQLFPERVTALRPGSWWLRVLARPKSGVSLDSSRAQLRALWPGITKELVTSIQSAAVRAAILKSTLDLVPGGTGWTYLRKTFTPPLMVLMAIVALVLLVACVNVANLLLTRAAARRREIGVRIAIGAGRWRLVRQLLTESLLLAVLGAGIGIAFAYAGDRLLLRLFANWHGLPFSLDVSPDARVLAFTGLIALITSVIFGLAPALRATASAPGAALKDAQISGKQSVRLSAAFAVAQVAFSLVLLIGAGLFVRTLDNLETLDMGFRREGVLLVNLDPRHAGYKDARLTALYEELWHKVSTIPGVKSASLSWNTPLSGLMNSDPVLVDGRPPENSSQRSAHFNNVSPRYFTTMGIPLLLGRDFDERDNASAPPVAIVNEEFVRAFLKGANPLGRRVSSADSRSWQNLQIVGVVKNTISFDARTGFPPAVFVPYFQITQDTRGATIEVRVQGSLASTADAVRRVIHTRLPDTALTIVPFTKQVADSLVQERLVAAMASFFGLLALALAGVGLYGLLNYTVERRSGEIGIRMALGATRRGVVGLVLRDAFGVFSAGIAIGLVLALAVSSLITKMLFGVRAADPLSAGVAICVLAIIVGVAASIPARRATKVDPVIALKYE